MQLTQQPAKGIYLANRHPRFTREQFADRWRRHATISGSLDPRIKEIAALRYCLTHDPSGILPCATDEHDGVALLALRSVLSAPAFGSMMVQNEVAYADELRVFERPVEDFTLITASELLVAGPETEVAVIEFVRRRADVAPTTWLRGLDAARDQLLTDTGLTTLGLRRWVRNSLIAPAARGFNYDAVNEFWFDSLADVARAADGLEALFAAGAETTDRRNTTVLVTTVIERIGKDLPVTR